MKQYISLYKALPYFKVLDQYFGQCLPGLTLILSEIEMNGEDEDRFLGIFEQVTESDLLEVFRKAKLDTERDGFRYVDLLWLVCNMYYGENYNEFTKAQQSSNNGVYKAYDNIRESSAKLFVLLNNYHDLRKKLAEEEKHHKKPWEERTREQWRKRRAEIRLERERKWGAELVDGPDWKSVASEIAKETDSLLEEEKKATFENLEEMKRVTLAKKDLERVTLKIGDDSLTMESAGWWFEDLFRNHLFTHFLRDVKTTKQAKALYTKPKGKKPEDNRVTAIIYGISQLFFDRGLVETKTPANLTSFIQNILRLMDLKNNEGKLPSVKQVEKLIENLPKAKTDPKFFSASLTPLSREQLLLDSDDPENDLNWLMSPSRK